MDQVSRIEAIVVDVVRDTAERYGLTCPTLGGGTCPMRDVPGLDSLHCVEMIVDIGGKIPIDADNNVFWTVGGHLRTIQQIAKHLASCVRST